MPACGADPFLTSSIPTSRCVGSANPALSPAKADSYALLAQHNARGVLAMANKGPNTNGSQFFFTYAKQTHLDKVYTVFGK